MYHILGNIQKDKRYKDSHVQEFLHYLHEDMKDFINASQSMLEGEFE